MTPENSTHTGVGATACASASQKWNGTIAALTSSPARISRNATTTSRSGVAGGPGADLRHVQRAGAAVDQRDAGQRQVGANAVGDREVQRSLQRPAFLRPVGGQRVGRHAHQLEPDKQVEDVAGEAEPGHARQEDQHQRVVVGRHSLEVPPGEHHGSRHQHRGRGRARPALSEPASKSMPIAMPRAGRKPANQYTCVAARHLDHDDRQHDRHARRRSRWRPASSSQRRLANSGPSADDRGGDEQRDRDRERRS